MGFAYKYTYNALQDRFRIPESDLGAFIEAGLLVPDEWQDFNAVRRAEHVQEGFRMATWDVQEVERFERLIRIFQRNDSLFTQHVER